MIHDFRIGACGREVHFKVDLDPGVITEYALLEYIKHECIPEPEVIQIMARALRPGDVAIDAGANIGFFTLLMSNLVGPSGWVHAFEPWQLHSDKLNQHVEMNRLMNVSVYAKGLWSRQERLFFKRERDSGENKVTLECMSESVTIWGSTFDHELPIGVKPRLIKLDIEGSELHALEGGAKLLETKPPYIVAEMNEPALEVLGSSASMLREFLYLRGYETFMLHPGFAVPVLIPRKTKLIPHKRCVNVLYCSIDAFAEIIPEVVM